MHLTPQWTCLIFKNEWLFLTYEYVTHSSGKFANCQNVNSHSDSKALFDNWKLLKIKYLILTPF